MQQRRVVRHDDGGKQAVAKHLTRGRAWDLPRWAIDWLVHSAGWAVVIITAIFTPVVMLAIILGLHALPLEFIGVPASDNGVGLAALVFVLEFALVALAIRPLFDHRSKGWRLLVAAAAVNLVHSILLDHAISGAVLLALVCYGYMQVRRSYLLDAG